MQCQLSVSAFSNKPILRPIYSIQFVVHDRHSEVLMPYFVLIHRWRNLKHDICTRIFSITYARVRIVCDKLYRVDRLLPDHIKTTNQNQAASETESQTTTTLRHLFHEFFVNNGVYEEEYSFLSFISGTLRCVLPCRSFRSVRF